MGSCANRLPSIDLNTMRQGLVLSIEVRNSLVSPISYTEIVDTINSINDAKAPSIDGLNAMFFKHTWPNIKEDIYIVVLDFCRTGKMCKQINIATLTLVPKVTHPTMASDFRLIACCTFLYKIIAQIITTRLQRIIGEIADCDQSGFIPQRHISDNILLATEFIKGYTRKHNSPRCMVKVDFKKAYDSIEWPFLKAVLTGLGFPGAFINWILACVTTVSYTILINGLLGTPIQAKKGLRQGDPLSPFLFAIGIE